MSWMNLLGLVQVFEVESGEFWIKAGWREEQDEEIREGAATKPPKTQNTGGCEGLVQKNPAMVLLEKHKHSNRRSTQLQIAATLGATLPSFERAKT
ncbi:hypothetical protein SADUNF_Sadunf08G0176100 [Salix dunnii]|uniref:Uncharacterized protein n=1 Tax=Salix dunnii TaxID=1413687 RepID=A0A835MVA9_9ROSI|nr:hypothetical protein SADUNF_Sadunf08G0176100 [Salix dunnii]